MLNTHFARRQIPHLAIPPKLPPQNADIAGNKRRALGPILLRRQTAHRPPQIGIVPPRQGKVGGIIGHDLKVGHEVGHVEVEVDGIVRDGGFAVTMVAVTVVAGSAVVM